MSSALHSSTRSQVLAIFKKLLRTRQLVFGEDINALDASRKKIREEFTKHKSVTEPNQITELIKVANESEELLRTKVMQLKEVRPNVFNIRKDHFPICVNAKRERCADCSCGAFD